MKDHCIHRIIRWHGMAWHGIQTSSFTLVGGECDPQAPQREGELMHQRSVYPSHTRVWCVRASPQADCDLQAPRRERWSINSQAKEQLDVDATTRDFLIVEASEWPLVQSLRAIFRRWGPFNGGTKPIPQCDHVSSGLPSSACSSAKVRIDIMNGEIDTIIPTATVRLPLINFNQPSTKDGSIHTSLHHEDIAHRSLPAMPSRHESPSPGIYGNQTPSQFNRRYHSEGRCASHASTRNRGQRFPRDEGRGDASSGPYPSRCSDEHERFYIKFEQVRQGSCKISQNSQISQKLQIGLFRRRQHKGQQESACSLMVKGVRVPTPGADVYWKDPPLPNRVPINLKPIPRDLIQDSHVVICIFQG